MKALEPEDANLVVSLLTGQKTLFKEALAILAKKFGQPDILSEARDFNRTDYYEKEFGGGLQRKIVSFKKTVRPVELAEIKLFTNKVEKDFSAGEKRRVNMDPGYLTLEKFVLASCKNFPHRIYLRAGVYAEATLIYSDNGFRALEWTYPDYGDRWMTALLKEIRKRYALKIKRGLKFD